jgi:hypothetical protein
VILNYAAWLPDYPTVCRVVSTICIVGLLFSFLCGWQVVFDYFAATDLVWLVIFIGMNH